MTEQLALANPKDKRNLLFFNVFFRFNVSETHIKGVTMSAEVVKTCTNREK